MAVAVTLALFRPADPTSAVDPEPRPGSVALEDYASVQSKDESPSRDDQVLDAASGGVPSLATLRRLCPDPWTEGVSGDCEAALAERYRNEGMRTADLHDDGLFWASQSVPLPAEIAWAEAFADPAGVRRAVSEALRDPECLAFADLADMREVARFPPFELYPWDDPVPEGLSGACAAAEAAKLAMLHEGCVVMLHSGGRGPPSPGPESAGDVVARMSLRERDTAFHHDELWRLHVEDLDADPTLTAEEYWHRREQIEDERFRFAWRRLMCHATDQSAFAMLDALPDPGHDRHQGKYLRWYAARFGNEWARAVAPDVNRQIGRYSAR